MGIICENGYKTNNLFNLNKLYFVLQSEQAYQFVLRHISEDSTDYTGVYRNDRWEYPIIAIREVIRNAVIHRDYSMSGIDIKIAVFNDLTTGLRFLKGSAL